MDIAAPSLSESELVELLASATSLADFGTLTTLDRASSSNQLSFAASCVVVAGSFGGHNLALKALIASGADGLDTGAMERKFGGELELGDASCTPARLPPHRSVLRAVRTFVDDVHALPPSIVAALQTGCEEALVSQTYVMIFPRFAYTLRSVVSESSLPLDGRVVLSYFQQVLEGAKHLHDNGIAHRDLTPSNVMLSGESDALKRRVVIVDLSTAIDCYDTDVGATDWIMPCSTGTSKGGAQDAVAPEVHAVRPSRRAMVDYRGNDAYALGHIANAMLRTSRPFNQGEFVSLDDSIKQALGTLCCPRIVTVHEALLRRDPASRMTIRGALDRIAAPLPPISLSQGGCNRSGGE